MVTGTTTSEREKPSNGKANWTNWPSVFKAAKILGIKVQHVRILVQTGDLPVFEGTDGTQRFDPQVLADLRADIATLTDEDFDTSIATKKLEQKELDAVAERQGIPVDAVRAQAEFVRTIINHNKELHGIIVAMAEDARKNLNASNAVHEAVIKRQNEQLEHYHRTNDVRIAERERELALKTERDLVLLQEQDKIDRRQQVLGIAKEQAGKLVSIIAAKLGVNEGMLQGLVSKFDPTKLQAALAFFESIQPDQVDIAMASGFFTPDQVQHLSTITGRPAPNVEEKPTQESESTCESPQAESPSQQQPTPS